MKYLFFTLTLFISLVSCNSQQKFDWNKSDYARLETYLKKEYKKVYEDTSVYIFKWEDQYGCIYQKPEINIFTLEEHIHSNATQGTRVMIDSSKFNLDSVVYYFRHRESVLDKRHHNFVTSNLVIINGDTLVNSDSANDIHVSIDGNTIDVKQSHKP